MSRIGVAIANERRSCQMTLNALAEQVGISRSYLNNLELGSRLPPHSTLLRIANVFPDIDSTEWTWLLVEDWLGADTVRLMRQHAMTAAIEPRFIQDPETRVMYERADDGYRAMEASG